MAYNRSMKLVNFSDLVGQFIVDAIYGNDAITFKTTDNTYKMYHEQDCCENVFIEDISGDLKDLIGQEILEAYESSSSDGNDPEWQERDEYDESYTWTFYRIRTNLDTFVIRWYGTSNGYYSESVDFYLVD